MSSINYEIESRVDFLTGMYLITRIPDSDLDENALHTIQEDCPDFIMPFNYKSINGQIEFTYKVGTLNKLQYYYGDISHAEYVALWMGILKPLLECRDWFMNPKSFVLSTDNLYYDKNKKTVVYIYIPSIKGCSGFDAFNEMAIEISKCITVSDPVLENKVLRSIVNDFNPNEFLKMLAEHLERQESLPQGYSILSTQEPPMQSSFSQPPIYDCTLIDEETETEHFLRNSSKKKLGAIKLFKGKSGKKTEVKRNGFKNVLPSILPIHDLSALTDASGITQETKVMLCGTRLRCIGHAHFPQAISIDIDEGDVFTIGRYDADVGKKRSSFEFEAKTKAVSRRHAVIERNGSVYRIIDLSSSAGTFVNGKKIPPNAPHELTADCRVSFGNLGADYVWETC